MNIVLATNTYYIVSLNITWMVKLRHRSNKIQSKKYNCCWYWHYVSFSIVTCKAYNSNIHGLFMCCVHRCTIGCASFVMLNYYGFLCNWKKKTHTHCFWFEALHSTETSFKIVWFSCHGHVHVPAKSINIYTLPIVKLFSC